MTEEHVPAPPAPVQEYSPPAPEYAPPERVAPAPQMTGAALGALVLQAKLAVGPASDPYEDEADDVAEQVVKTLRVQRLSSGVPTPGSYAPTPQRIARRHLASHAAPAAPPIEVRRIMRSLSRPSTPIAPLARWPVSRIQRMATIGADGGNVDSDTEQAIRQSSGKIMPAKARSTMEGAFGADFSGVRVHTGPAASELSTRIQAKAFTTGNDIFFRDGMPDTSTTGGQSLLAHELTHTIQQTGQTQRSASIMRAWYSIGRKKKSDPIVAEPVVAGPDSPDTQAMLAKMGYKNIIAAGPAAGGATEAEPASEPAAEPAKKPFAGVAGQSVDANMEAAKPAAVVAVAATAGASTAGAMGHVNVAGTGGGGVLGTATAGGVAGGVLGIAGAVDGVVGLHGANARRNEGQVHDDAAMSKQGSLMAKDSGANLAMGAANTGRGVASTVDVAQGTAALVAEGAAPAAAGIAAGALGAVVGTAMVIQGTWRGGKAALKLFRLTHGSGEKMLTADGERWKKVIVGAEKFKVAINSLKVAAGALGIAAGALMMVGSPIGWVIGLAAAIIGGAYAASKLIGRIRNARDKMNAHATAAGLSEIGDPTDVTQMTSSGERKDVSLAGMGYDSSKVITAGPQNEADTGAGFTTESDTDGERPDDSEARIEAIEKADKIATMASKNAQIAAELRDALANGDKEYVFAMVEAITGNPDDDLDGIIKDLADRRLFDAFSLLSAINIDPELALADSGQALIEQKLSKAEAM
jgi:hypothetical protein